MSVHLTRAEVLLAQSRPADAERETRVALAEDPGNATAHVILALCCVHQNRTEEGLREARTAVSLAPAEPMPHRILSFVLHRMGRQTEALASIREALRMDPHDAEAHVLQSAVQFSLRNWKLALQSAEDALAIDAEHVEAANFRAMALTQLGRKQEAAETVDFALSREPDNALSHANQGWNCLHQNDPRRAQVHFREALRLNPGLDYARQGMLEALKARNPVYRLMLAYYLWIGRQSGWLQAAFIIGIFFGGRIIGSLSESFPDLQWLFTPLLALFFLFIYLSWTSQPLFNLMLRLDRFGRHVLSPDQRLGSTLFGIVLAALIATTAAWLISDSDTAGFGAVTLAVLSLCVAATWLHRARVRLILGAATAGLAVLGAAATLMIHNGQPMAGSAQQAFFFAFILFQLIALSSRSR
ncbi:MAG: tetratricopeptide repeat protein [Opitutaceae bacterium]|nr:tetratricopeptide repeat protein [Opitutaceae bacterium]